MLFYISIALRQRLRMADDRFDLSDLRARKCQEILFDIKAGDPVHIQISGIHQIHDVSDFTGITVLQWEHHAVDLSLFCSCKSRFKIAKGDQFRLREQPFCRDIGIGPRDSAVSDFHAVHQFVLIRAGDVHDTLLKIHIIWFEFFVLDLRTAFFDHDFFPCLIFDRQGAFFLILRDFFSCLHPLFKELYHLIVNLVDLFSDLIKIFQFQILRNTFVH